MYFVKIINRTNINDIIVNNHFEKIEEAQKYYNRIKSIACLDKNKIIRQTNQELEQNELKYCDVILYLKEEEKIISKFMIG